MTSALLVATCAVMSLSSVVVVTASCRATHDLRDVAPSPDSAPELAWKDKSFEQRAAHMKSVVHPVMSAVFARFDPVKFAEFECRTCHGSGASDGSFTMPNPDLPRLPGAADGFETLMAEKEKVTTFMAVIVVPAMAATLGEKPYGPDARDGFGCFRCHVIEK